MFLQLGGGRNVLSVARSLGFSVCLFIVNEARRIQDSWRGTLCELPCTKKSAENFVEYQIMFFFTY